MDTVKANLKTLIPKIESAVYLNDADQVAAWARTFVKEVTSFCIPNHEVEFKQISFEESKSHVNPILKLD